MTNPFSGLADFHFHSRTVRGSHPSRFDPVVKPRFTIAEEAKIMTMGSCFAQHVSKWLLENGYEILLRETENYLGGGMFSANYGNVYTVAQAQQLFDRAFGIWAAEEGLHEKNGRYYDPLRPSVTQNGYSSGEEVLANRSAHEKIVRELFLETDVLVFTLGLTEAFVRKSDGAVLPSAPGVIAGDYDSSKYEFKNFTYDEVFTGLSSLIQNLVSVNPAVKLILTVSPVPLAATYEDRHVSVSSLASKAKLRAVVEQVLSDYSNVDYFPSFEIFMTPGIGANYFESDARNVRQAGVLHAMSLFEKHFTERGRKKPISNAAEYRSRLLELYDNVVCDEEKADAKID